VRVALGVIYQMSNAMHQKFKERWKAAKSEINLVISATINKLVLEHHSAWFTTLIRNPEVWQKPSSPFYKVNYDTAIRPSFLTQAAVIINSSGAVIKCSSLISSLCLALFGEARATLLAVQLVISLNLPSFILEGDSLTVTLALQNPTITQDWCITFTISQIHSIIPLTTSSSASYVNRSANFYAHHMASWATTRLHSDCILISSAHLGLVLPDLERLPLLLF